MRVPSEKFGLGCFRPLISPFFRVLKALNNCNCEPYDFVRLSFRYEISIGIEGPGGVKLLTACIDPMGAGA